PVALLNIHTVCIASLVALLPGMAITNAMNELSSQHSVSGTVRFAVALTTVLKLTVGAVVAVTLLDVVGLEPQARALPPQPEAVEWLSMVVASFAFAVLFKASARDYP